MSQTAALFAALKRVLKSRGLSYRELADKLAVSEPTVKRLFSVKALTLARLGEICEVLDISFLDLAKLAEDSSLQTGLAERFTARQEESLAGDPKLAAYFYLLLHRWSPEAIEADYDFEAHEAELLRLELARLGLIERREGYRIHLKVVANVAWAPHGPLAICFARQAQSEFLAGALAGGEHSRFLFRARELSASSLRSLALAEERLAKEFERLAQADASLPKDDTFAMGLVIAARPFEFTLFQRFKRST